MNKHELILVVGQSGAGRTTVIHILDDQGFDTLDNVPVHLIPRVAPRELVDKPLALGLDIRSKSFSLPNLMKEISKWKALSESRVVILFLLLKEMINLSLFMTIDSCYDNMEKACRKVGKWKGSWQEHRDGR